MLTNKNSRVLFYNLSDCLNRRGFRLQYVRHTNVSENVHGLLQLQKRDRSYFIGKLFELSEKDDFEVEHLGTETDIEKNDLLLDAITNLQICNNFYNTLCNTVGDNLQVLILSRPTLCRDVIDRDMQLNDWIYLNFAESKRREIMRAYDYLYYINGRFPADDNLITLPEPKIPDFIQADDAISPIFLHKQFSGGKSHALVYM